MERRPRWGGRAPERDWPALNLLQGRGAYLGSEIVRAMSQVYLAPDVISAYAAKVQLTTQDAGEEFSAYLTRAKKAWARVRPAISESEMVGVLIRGLHDE